MSHISRIASPMSLCEEDLFDVDKKVQSKIRLLEQLQKESPASFLVGTIGKINQRITNLDEELSKYESQLEIDSRTPEPQKRTESYAESYSPSMSIRGTTPSEKKYGADVEKQAPGTPRAKSSDAPRLVELQQFPGWNKKKCAPLPHSLQTNKVLDNVVAAQPDLKHKVAFRREFCRLLFSKMQESILQDGFWWFFLRKFHPDPINQGKLFKRISTNFVGLLLSAEIPKYRDLFFANYGTILAQSIYAAFCLAFPQSWRQFDEPAFKEMLAQVCGEWISGIPPPPRSYEKWNMAALEPDGMRKEEVIKKKKRPDHAAKSLGGRASSYSSAASTKTSSIRSPTGSQKTHGLRMHTAKSDAASCAHSPKLTPRVAELASEQNALSTITEEPLTSTTESTAGLRTKFIAPKSDSSCAAGRAMEFSRNVFNVYGRSPLLVQFSRQYGFEKKSFFDVLVQHSLIQTPPAKDAQTYQDIIYESRIKASAAAQSFKHIYEEDMKAHKSFCAKQREELQNFKKKTDKLLSKPRQVHYLSNLILMEMKNLEEDTNPVGATATVQAALSAESAD
ncbi:protein FAM227A-like [Styela clava]